MSRAYESGNLAGGGNSVSQTASKAASIIDERVHKGADAVSNAAHQTADQLGKASDYVWRKSERLREGATNVAEMASAHPAYTWIAIGMVAFGLGYFLRGSRQDR